METTTMSTESSYITSTPASSPSYHQSRPSLTSLYDLLADLDENQLQYLIQEMNNTTSQNMAVGQAVSAFEAENPSHSLSAARANMQLPTMQRQLSKSQRVRLSLQTLFRAPSTRQQRQRTYDATDDGLLSTPTGRRKSPAYKRISRPAFNLPPGVTVVDLLNMLEAEFFSAPLSPSCMSNTSSSFSSSPSPTTTSSSSGRIRRYPSTIDMALEAERSASGAEGIGLGMLEPRPTTPCTPIGAKTSPFTLMNLTPTPDRRARGETPPPPPVILEGIFEVLENR